MKHWLYIALQLDADSRKFLEIQYGHICPVGWKRHMDHVTLAFNDHSEQAETFAADLQTHIGERKDFTVTAIGYHGGVVAARVQLPDDLPCANAVPHVTLAVKDGCKPKDSNLIEHWNIITTPVPLSGTVITVTPKTR